MDMKQVIKNTLLTSNVPLSFAENVPEQYADREHEWYSRETLWFIDKYAKYSSDYTVAQVQGLDPTKPFEFTTVHIRLADVVTSSASSSRTIDDHKNILIAEKEYTYIRRGAKVVTMGSTWLVVNPMNLSGGDGSGLIQRCDAVWHYLDFYGNVCSEPMAVNKDALRTNDPDAQRSTMIAKGYFTARMQYNDVTKSLLDNNSRMILGTGAYHLSGWMDFIQEFTSDESSVNLLEFTMRWEEPDDAIDDMVNKVAGGKTFKWEILIDGQNTLKEGGTAQLTAQSIRTNENRTEEVFDSEEHPITYEWESSDPEVCTVDSDGVVTAVGEGTATITATLVQNPNNTATYDIMVEAASAEPHVEFDSDIPASIRAYSSATISATYYENGEPTEDAVTWTLSGASAGSYTYKTSGNSVTVSCWNGSVEPLVITATANGQSADASIWLVGL